MPVPEEALHLDPRPRLFRPLPAPCSATSQTAPIASAGAHQLGEDFRATTMELTELLPHVARGLNIDWDEATRYAGLNAES
jgi:hypothetical protein